MSSRKTLWNELKDPDFAHAYFDEYLNTFIATQIKVIREEQRMTQGELAQAAGMKQERISVLENVNYSSWTIATLRRIARAFGLRLRVSFETFSSGIPEVKNFTKEHLLRKTLSEEIEERLNPSPDIPSAKSITDFLQKSAEMQNKYQQGAITIVVDEKLRRPLASIGEDKSDETHFSGARAGNMAVPLNRLKSQGEGHRAGWIH